MGEEKGKGEMVGGGGKKKKKKGEEKEEEQGKEIREQNHHTVLLFPTRRMFIRLEPGVIIWGFAHVSLLWALSSMGEKGLLECWWLIPDT